MFTLVLLRFRLHFNAFWVHFGSILHPFSSVLVPFSLPGEARGGKHPKCPPNIEISEPLLPPLGGHFSSKIRKQIAWSFMWFVKGFYVQISTQNASKMMSKWPPKPLKTIKKNVMFFNQFFNRFWMVLEDADPQSDSPPPTFSCNPRFSPSDAVLLKTQPKIQRKSSQNPSQNRPKINAEIWLVFALIFDLKMQPRGPHLGAKTVTKTASKFNQKLGRF